MKLVVGLLLLVFVCHNTAWFPFQPVADLECEWAVRVNYRGTKNETKNGYTCQNWLSQSPNKHSMTPSQYPDAGLGNHNYCRNPDDASHTWCYTTNGPRWEYCEIVC